MNAKVVSTRRRFFCKAGAVISAPFAAAIAQAGASSALSSAQKESRLQELEDLNAIRTLRHSFARFVNEGAYEDAARLFADPASAIFDESIGRLVADEAADAELIERAADGRSARSSIRCYVEIETAIASDCTLAQMACQQGEGYVRRTEHRVLELHCQKRGADWVIGRSAWLAA